MNNWQPVENEQLASLGWHLWTRNDIRTGIVYQTTTNESLTPKSQAGFISLDMLMKTKQHIKTLH